MDPVVVSAAFALAKELVPLVLKDLAKSGRLREQISEAELTVALYRAMDERDQLSKQKTGQAGGAGNGTL
jgi:DNA-binding TFAR19-related protein (PDSD5 family)